MIGGHFIKGWSRTQNSITLSSAEAELVAMVKMATELLGVIYLARDWGYVMKGTVLADSSAALAITRRRGSGKLRHINVNLLWVQQKSEQEELSFVKVEGTVNPADLMTKYVNAEKLWRHAARLGLEQKSGRAECGLELQGVS